MIQYPTNVRDPNFVKNLGIYDAESKQDAANEKVLTEWNTTANNWALAAQGRINLGKQTVAEALLAAPALPVMTLTDDQGNITHPPFPGVVLPAIHDASSHSVPIVASAANTPLDRTDAILMMLQHLIAETDAIKAKVGA